MPGTKHLAAVAQVVAGLALNAFPAIFLAVYARIAPRSTPSFLALSLAIGVYVAQLLNASSSKVCWRHRVRTTA